MAIRPRKIPFDLSLAIRGETIGRLAADFGPAMAIFMAGSSIWTEWVELAIVHLRKRYDVWDDTGDARAFVIQEARHATALHHINKQLIGADHYIRDPRLGRVPALAHATMSDRIPIVSYAGPAEHAGELLRDAILYVTAFETAFSISTTAGAIETLRAFGDSEAAADKYLRHAAFFYVWFYHNTEEAEHSPVSGEYYERVFGPLAAIRDEVSDKVATALADFHGVCRALARHVGAPVEAELDQMFGPLATATLARIARVDRLDVGVLHESRRMFIREWDEVWEGRFRAAAER